MVLAVEVTKKSVTKRQEKLWGVTLNMVLTDNTVEVLNVDYTVPYRTGDVIVTKEAKFIALMQADIDAYKSEQNIFTSAALNTAVTNVETGLEV